MRVPSVILVLALSGGAAFAAGPGAGAAPGPRHHACPEGLPTGDIVPGVQAAPSCPSSAYTLDADLAYGTDPAQKLDLYRPRGASGRLPTVVWIHGGGWRSGDKTQLEQSRRLVCHGYALASVNYRLSGQALFPAQVDDVKAAIAFLRAHASAYGLDPRRFAAFGSSAGGHLAALAGTSGPILGSGGAHVRAVVDWYGPVDFARMDEQLLAQGCNPGTANHGQPGSAESQLLGCTVSDPACAASVRAADPAAYATISEPAFLLLHGDADCTVPRAQDALLQAALTEAGGCVLARTVRGAGHGGPAWSTPEVQDPVAGFLDAVLAAGPSLDDAEKAVNCPAFLVSGDPTSGNGADWTYDSVDDGVHYVMEGILFAPAGAGPFPAVVVSHGKMGTPRGYSAGVARTMVGWGLVVIGPMYTHAPDAEDAGHLPDGGDGASDANVLRAHKAKDLLGCLGTVDLSRLAAHGHSMGAFVTGQLIGTYPGEFRAASHSAGGVSQGPNATRPATAAAIATPYEIHHAITDEVVNFAFDVALEDILARHPVEHRLVSRPYAGLTHEGLSQDPDMLERVRRWYMRHGVLP